MYPYTGVYQWEFKIKELTLRRDQTLFGLVIGMQEQDEDYTRNRSCIGIDDRLGGWGLILGTGQTVHQRRFSGYTRSFKS
eukprot:1340833-Amorphochlora_amoeboformis.AAC.1